MPATTIDRLPENRLMAEFSMWSADLLRLGDELDRIARVADLLHIDVADGHFAPSMLFFPDLVAAMKKRTKVPIHVHLMVDDAVLVSQASEFAAAGADLVSIHVENVGAAAAALDRLAEMGVAAGMVLQVSTPVATVAQFLPRLRFLTLLGTAIGVKGQSLDPRATGRLREARTLIAASGARHRIVVAADGGIREQTVPLLRAAGAETVVLGSLAFGAPDLAARIGWLHALPAPAA